MQQLRVQLAPAIALLGLIAALMPWEALHAEDIGGAVIMTADGSELFRFSPFLGKPVGSVAAADLGNDGVEELLFGASSGENPVVAIHRQDGSFISSFLAYDPAFTGGVNVTACDVDGDGQNEIITGAQFGGGPHVRVFAADGSVQGGFFAYDATFRGGVNVACGDIDGDGTDEIITGSGLTGGPHIRAFAADGTLRYEVFNGSASQNTGAFVAIANVDGDNDDEIIASSMGHDASAISVYDLNDDQLVFRSAIPFAARYGSPVFSIDSDGDGHDEIGTTSNGHAENNMMTFSDNGNVINTLSPFTSDAPIRAIAVTEGLSQRFIAVQSTNPLHDDIGARTIQVDISKQNLTAYEFGIPVKTFLVSTGLPGFDTPLGKTDVKAKLLWHDYVWTYGVNDQRNYNIPNVKYNLRIYNHIYIHYAYWHNAFGTRRSHGCINVNFENAEWIYNWSDIGTTVDIVP
ncbi:MAG: L,D-transpeptidase family protein [Candidatus Uhrbacteria bacterium]|nr:L,D-transpeptidase family protein [Candidatus Uhrbacteria bacterium]